MKLPQLEIPIPGTDKVLRPRLPFIMGGAGLGITDGVLAGHAAKAGMIAIISGTLRRHDILKEIQTAREIAGPEGIIGVNVLGVMSDFKETMEMVLPHVDVFSQGAKFIREPFKRCYEEGVAFIPVISNPKSIALCEKLQAAAIVIESNQGGGHQGTDKNTWELAQLEEIRNAKVPVIAAGGIVEGTDAAKLLNMGYSGLQLTTVFILTKECTVAERYKRRYWEATPDQMIRFLSPSGLPGMALYDDFLLPYIIGEGKEPSLEPTVSEKQCIDCMPHCSKTFCLRNVLWEAYKTGNKLIFCGGNVARLKEYIPDFNDLPSVDDVCARIVGEIESYNV